MLQPLKIFLSYSPSPDFGILPIGTPPVPTKVEKLYHRLQYEKFEPWLDKYNILPGEQISDRNSIIEEAIRDVNVFLVCLSEVTDYKIQDYELDVAEKTRRYNHDYVIIPVFLEKIRNQQDATSKISLPIILRETKEANISSEQELELLIKGLHQISERLNKKSSKQLIAELIAAKKSNLNLQVLGIELNNIRCFEQLELNLKNNDETFSWVMILGDNAVGKSTLLRSIALGLCNESDAVALMKSVPGNFVRQGATEGYIKIQLQGTKNRSKTYTITTEIKNENGREIIRQKTEPVKDFPWGDIFACGYGAYRAAQAHASYDSYRTIEAVRSLFDSQVSLQNPEIVLLRRDREVRQQLERKLLNILMLDDSNNAINYAQQGLEMNGPWGKQPFEVLSDGYRSTTQWVLDFLGWAIHADRLSSDSELGGILLIDEIEQHLHPRWQRYIVQRLRQQFPKTQIIASTHTPLAASGIVDVDPSLLVKLEQNSEGKIDLRVINKQLLKGKRADQVLVSEAFGLVTTQNPGSKDDINRYAELLGKSSRTEAEETELQELRSYLQDAFQFGENEVERTVKKAVDEALDGMTQNISPELLDLETKKQLKELFQSEVSL